MQPEEAQGASTGQAGREASAARNGVDENNAEASTTYGDSKAKATFITLCASLVVVNTTFSIMGPILPQEAERRGISPGTVGLIFSIYAFTNFAVSPYLGKALQNRLIERRTLLLIGQVVCAASTACFGLVTLLHTPSAFAIVCLILRVVNGLGSAAVDTASFAIISGLFAESDLFGMMMGIAESFLSLGWIVGPLVGGYLADLAGFAAPFILTAALAFLSAPVLAFLMPPGDALPGEAPKVPITIAQLLSQPMLSVLLVTGFFAAMSLTFLDPLLGPFLQNGRSWSASLVGLCFGVAAIVYAIITPIAGWLGDKVGMLIIIVAGLFLMAVAYLFLGPAPFLMPVLGSLYGSWLIWASLSVAGMAAGMAFVPLLPAMLNHLSEVGLEEEGLTDVVSGLLSGSFSLGGGVGPLLGGVLANFFGFEWAAAVFGALLAATGLAVCAVRMCTGRKGGESAADAAEAGRSLADGNSDHPRAQVPRPLQPRPMRIAGVRPDMLRTPAVPPLSPRISGWQGQPNREPLLQAHRSGS